MKWISATDLNSWADRNDSHGLMPEVVRRLIHGTTDALTRTAFPSQESVYIGGWDGLAETDAVHPFVPRGVSAWEFSSEKNPKSKADRIYDTRKQNPHGAVPLETTFVFATPRRWPGKKKWEKDQKADGFWRDVRVYDSDDLEQWIELAPAVGAWLGKTMGKYPAGIQSVDDFWQEFSSGTSIPIPPDLLLAGRDAQLARLLQWLSQPPSALTVVADSELEASAFVAAALCRPADDRTLRLSRAVRCWDLEALREVARAQAGHLIIHDIQDTAAVGKAVANGHHVAVSVGRSGLRSPESEDNLELPTPARESFVQGLIRIGLVEEEARRLAQNTARSITILRRLWAVAGTPSTPRWSTAVDTRVLVTTLLLGSWNQSIQGDQNAASALAGINYGTLESFLTTLASQPDAPPIRRVGDLWSLVSPLDAWYLLGQLVNQSALESFLTVVEDVLTEEDPSLSLRPEDRWKASIYGKNWKHSKALRHGLAESLVLLALHGDGARLQLSIRAQDIASSTVFRLLGSGPGWKRWYSLAGLLPVLAEAAPDTFLGALEVELQGNSTDIRNLFVERGFLGGGQVHVGLLWALEELAWYPEWIGRVTKLLGRLAELFPPETKSGNNPIASLRAIYLPWYPQTGATREQRSQAMGRLLKNHPAVGWELLLALLPRIMDSSQNSYRPRWREAPNFVSPSPQERFGATSDIINHAFTLAQPDTERLAQLTKHHSDLPPNFRVEMRSKLRDFASTNHDPKARTRLWQAVSELSRLHRAYPDADWAIPVSEVKDLEEIGTSLEPKNPRIRYAWLFNVQFPDLPDALKTEHFAYEQRLGERRKEAIAAVLSESGVPEVLGFASEISCPYLVGYWAPDSLPRGDWPAFLEKSLNDEKYGLQLCGIGFVARALDTRSRPEIDLLFRSLCQTLREDARANFLLALPPNHNTWNLAEDAGEAVATAYWSKVQFFPREEYEDNDIHYALAKLVAGKRALSALSGCLYARTRISNEDIIKVLDASVLELNANADGPLNNIAYEVEQLLHVLRVREAPNAELIRLEWTFLPILSMGFSANVPTLHSGMSQDPAFFAEVIRTAYRPKHGVAAETSEQESESAYARAHKSVDLLQSWHVIPGSHVDRSIDESALRAWVGEARRLCAASDHTEIGDEYIGKVFASAPVDPSDQVWPHRAVREVIEEVGSSELDLGLQVAIFNQRGVCARDPFAGGEQERGLSAGYRERSSFMASAWPRLASVFRALADQYDGSAVREDHRSRILDMQF
jgi:hypothetical protein